MSETRDRLANLSPEKRALLVRRLGERRGREAGADEAWPTIVPDPAGRQEPFSLTPLQEAYWIGRDASLAMGRVATHSYMELEGEGLDLGRIEAAWNRLIERHDALRIRVLPDGRQQAVARVDRYRIPVEDLSDLASAARERRLEELRTSMSHAVPDAGTWPLFDLRAALLPGDRLRLFLGVDALIVDAWSVRLLFEEWASLYRDPEADLPPLELSLRDYVLGLEQLEDTERFERAREHWAARVPGLPPPPELPLAAAPESLSEIRFVRRTAELDADRWGRIRERAGRAGMTATAVALAAYADVLSLWAERPRFTLSVPQLNRHPLHPEVDRLVGELASFILLEVDNRGDAGFSERARRHQARLWEDLDHAVFGGVRVLRQLARVAEGGQAPMMPVVFTSAPQQGGQGGVGAALPDGPWRVVYVNNQSSQVWLDNHLSERDGALVCDWDTVDALFPEGMPADMLDSYMRHLERLADDEGWWERSWMDQVGELLPVPHVAVIDRTNDTAAPIPEERIQDGFFRQVLSRPEADAVATPGRRLGYGELAAEIRSCADRLREAGTRRDDLVAIVMQKGWEQVVAAYAVLETGAAYLPLDAADPPARRASLLERAGVRLALVQPRLEDEGDGWPEGVRRLTVKPHSGGPEPERTPVDRPDGPEPDDVAFVLYTSGSTGEPKAVQVRHRGVVNALAATNEAFGLGPADRALGLTALHHDMSVFDVFGVLGAGGRLVLPEAGARRDPARWAELMRAEAVTVWNSVPAMMSMLLAWVDEGRGAFPTTLRLAFLGGDWIPVTLPERLRRHVPDAELVSVGGPTETTLWNIWHRIGEVDPAAQSIPYGRPIANTAYHVLSPEGVERPLWVPGELCVSGIGVTSGYLGAPEATAARRDRHPRTGEAVWRTGDIGRRRPDGVIEFLGRDDRQVQLHGHRVEPGEVEAHVARFEGVREACVAAVDQERGGPRLVAWVVWEEEDRTEALKGRLAAVLPTHMLPGAIVTLDALPLTPNGKIDRSALVPPDAESGGTAAPRDEAASPVERTVLEVVREVLEVEVPADGNLLAYGADSIDMVRIGNRLEERFGDRPAIDEIFRLQTPGALAGFYADKGPERQASGARDPLHEKLASYRVALAPEEREAFKARKLGTRDDLGAAVRIDLSSPIDGEELEAELWSRRSHRRYALRPIAAESFGGFLTGLRERPVHGKPKRLYASPGGLYPTQAYLHVKPGRVAGVPGGAYYYHPLEHRLVELASDANVGRDIHVPFVNAPIFDEAAFSIFLVVELEAIGPAYGERSLHFATLEAGVIAAALEAWAPRWGIGLCQIGDIRFDDIRHLFRLDEGHVFLHSLVGGRSAGDGPETWNVAAPEAARERLLEQIGDLSPEEVARILEARGEREP